MLTKTYSGSSEREVITLAKEELGNEIMIVDMRRIQRDASKSDTARQVILTVALESEQKGLSNLRPPGPHNQPGPILSQMNRSRLGPARNSLDETEVAELFLLRKQLRSMKARLRASRSIPFQVPFDFCYGLLAEAGVPDHVAEALVQRSEEQLLVQGAPSPSRMAALEELQRQIADLFLTPAPGKWPGHHEVVVFVGPSGAGKTSLIAKLASHKAIYRDRRVGIISTDIYRAGANAGLKTMGKILSVPIIEVRQLSDIPRAKKNLADYDVLLVDTPGRSPLSKGCLPELQTQLALLEPTETLLVLSANMGIEELWLYTGLYRGLKPTGLVVTKLDETNKPGKILGLVDDAKLPLKYVTTGQAVPQSLMVDVAQAVIKRLPLATGEARG
ncbi:MAG: hypothetical protein IID14_00530 [Candidatus Marinimicrobia bacterium]|nr:hypothetical protein [Candidatus Neomarinimicrobiota bacterium]